MKHIIKYKIQSLALLLVLAGLAFITSCTEDDDLNSDEVVLLSFGPSGVVHGEEITFIGENLDKVSAVILKPDVTIERAEFIDPSKRTFKIKVPQAAEAGKIILKTSQGDIESKSLLSFKVDVVVNSIAPLSIKPGNTITIKGTKINWIEKVTFTSDVEVEKADFVSQSQTELVVTVPFEAQSGFLIFGTGGTKPLTFASEDQLDVTVPAVSGLNPESIKHKADLTITGTDLDLISEVVFTGGDTVRAVDFVNHSETQIVVTVPATTEKGVITLRQLSPIEVTTGELSIILPVGTSVTPSPVIPGEDNITITGTNLDLVDSLKFLGLDDRIGSFVSQSATEIVVAVPEGASSGSIGYTTIHGYRGSLGVNIVVPSPQPDPLPLTVYDDEIFFGGEDWSWGHESTDIASGDVFHSGSVSFKHVQEGGDGGLQIGNLSGLDASEHKALVFSLFGGEGTDGATVAVILSDVWGNYNSVTLVEGEWTIYRIPLSEYPDVDLTDITRVAFKMENTTGGEILYADRIGFGAGNPDELSVIIYDDEPAITVGDGFGSTSFSVDYTENVREGDNAIEATYGGGGGGAPQFGTWGNDPVSVDGMQYFAFSVYGGEDTEGLILTALIKDGEGEYTKDVTIKEGEWQDFAIPLSELGGLTEVTELFFTDNDWSGTVYFDYIGFR